MADDMLHLSPDSFPEVFHDLVWHLLASTRIMLLKLPAFIEAASNPELVAILGDCVAPATRHAAALETILSGLDRPALLHTAELETLLGNAARELSGMSSGKTRDLGVTNVVQTAMHMAIPSCELALSLAAVLGYPQHATALTRLREDIAATDARMQVVMRTQVAAHRVAKGTSSAATSDLNAVP